MPLFVAVAILAVVVLHFGPGISWRTASVAVLQFLLIQLLLFSMMFRLRKSFQKTGDYRLGFVASGLYMLVMGLLGMHYAAKWGFVSPDSVKGDYLGFGIFVAIGTVLCVAVLSYWKKP